MQIFRCCNLSFQGFNLPPKCTKRTDEQKTQEHKFIPATDIPSFVFAPKEIKIRRIPDFIEFTPAKTINEAKEFARENLLINQYELTSVDCANYINEALSEYYNKNNAGRPVVTSVSLTSKEDEEYFATMGIIRDLHVSEKMFNNLDNHIEKYLNNETIKERLKDADETCNLTENQRKYFDFCKAGAEDFAELPFKEKIGLMLFLRGFSGERMVNNADGKMALPDGGVFWIINHEIGHEKHCDEIGLNRYMELNTGFKKGMAREDAKAKFREMEPAWECTLKVSDYASSNPKEFVADVFACAQNGVKFDDDVMKLYEKYSGPKIA